MGLWSFVEDAGSSLFGSKAEAATLPDADVLKAEMDGMGPVSYTHLDVYKRQLRPDATLARAALQA